MRFRIFNGDLIPVPPAGAAIVETFGVDEAVRRTGLARPAVVAVYEGAFPPGEQVPTSGGSSPAAPSVAGTFGRESIGLPTAGVADDPRQAAEQVDDATPESEAALVNELVRTTTLDRPGAAAEVARLRRSMPKTAKAGFPAFAAAVMRAVAGE